MVQNKIFFVINLPLPQINPKCNSFKLILPGISQKMQILIVVYQQARIKLWVGLWKTLEKFIFYDKKPTLQLFKDIKSTA